MAERQVTPRPRDRKATRSRWQWCSCCGWLGWFDGRAGFGLVLVHNWSFLSVRSSWPRRAADERRRGPQKTHTTNNNTSRAATAATSESSTCTTVTANNEGLVLNTFYSLPASTSLTYTSSSGESVELVRVTRCQVGQGLSTLLGMLNVSLSLLSYSLRPEKFLVRLPGHTAPGNHSRAVARCQWSVPKGTTLNTHAST